MAACSALLTLVAPTPAEARIPARSTLTPGVVDGVRLAVASGGSDRLSPAVRPAVDSRYWTSDTSFYTSPWYAGKHRKMIPFGCTRAPYYPPDVRCRGDRGFHHGLDIAMPCGTMLYARYRARVVDPSAPGALGPAYGAAAFRLRSARFDADFVIGHVRRVFVRPGQLVLPGQRIARSSDAAAPDGCHLHFEVRPAGGGYRSALAPGGYLGLRRVSG